MTLIEELERLAALRGQGALSEQEFVLAKARLLDATAGRTSGTAMAAVNRLRRSRGDRWVGGVCGGVAQATGVESWIWRLILSVLALFGGTGVLLYILLWIFVPDE
ncbi:MAG TPA: PspC domain-containing protein [Rubrivivax sp.]|jgi:phage shock protein C|nr:PspC domain-containing protein [Rubrivivax sp.]